MQPNTIDTDTLAQLHNNYLGGQKAASAKAVAPQKSPGLVSRLIGGLTQAPKYFLDADIVNPTRELAAQFSGNKTAAANAEQAQTNTLGGSASEIAKRLVGNTAQLGATVLAPELKGASLGAKIVAGAKTGAVIGGGSAAANDQGILEGAAKGAAFGGAIPLGAKILGVGGSKAAGTITDNEPQNALQKIKANLNNHFQQTEAAANGSNAGAKLPGSGPAGISLEQSQKLAQLADKYKIPAGSPSTRLRAIQGQLTTAGSEINDKIAQNNVSLDTTDKQAIMDEFNKEIAAQPNAKSLQGKASELSSHFLDGSGVKDLQGLNKYRQLVDEGINYNRQAGAPDPVAEQVGTIMRNTLSDQVGKYAPDVAKANSTFSELKSLEAPTLMENQKLAQTTGGLTNRLANNSIVKGAESKVANAGRRLTGNAPASAPDISSDTIMNGVDQLTPGSAAAPESVGSAPVRLNADGTPYESPIQMLGQAKDAAGGTVSKVLGSPLTQGAVRLGGANAVANPPATPIDNTQTQPQDLTGSDTSTDTSNPGPQFTQQDLVAAIASDPKNAATYEDLYKTLNAGASTDAGLNTNQQKEVTAGETAINRLQQYGQQLDQLTQGASGNVATGTVSTFLGKYNPLATSGEKQAAALSSSRRDVAIQLATALSGGTKPSAASVDQIEGSLPGVNDAPAERQDKLNAIISGLRTNIQTYATPINQLVSGLQ